MHSLPDGYETVIDEEGSNVSAGEKQLITIARAFLADPALLILDEATSSVDTRTEVLVQHAMAALRSDRTSFVIAHRLSTIRDADVILVMEDGPIVEQGNHDELLERPRALLRALQLPVRRGDRRGIGGRASRCRALIATVHGRFTPAGVKRTLRAPDPVRLAPAGAKRTRRVVARFLCSPLGTVGRSGSSGDRSGG